MSSQLALLHVVAVVHCAKLFDVLFGEASSLPFRWSAAFPETSNAGYQQRKYLHVTIDGSICALLTVEAFATSKTAGTNHAFPETSQKLKSIFHFIA